MTPEPNLGRIGEVFSEWAREGRGDRMEAGHRETAARVLDTLPEAPSRVLDLGTGNGWAAREAARRGASAVGIDVAHDMLVGAHARGGADYARAAFESLPFRTGSFDHVWSMEAIYYATNLDDALAELARVTRSGGGLTIVIDRYAENAASHDWPEQVGLAMHLLSEAEWSRGLESAGFSDVETTRLRAADGEDWKALEGSLLLRAVRT